MASANSLVVLPFSVTCPPKPGSANLRLFGMITHEQCGHSK